MAVLKIITVWYYLHACMYIYGNTSIIQVCDSHSCVAIGNCKVNNDIAIHAKGWGYIMY